MLDRSVVSDFLRENFEEEDIRIPKDVKMKDLVEVFCLYVEDDCYEWLKDNYDNFFRGLDWAWIRGRTKNYKNEYKENFV